jgi:hypothetical protein
MLPVQDKGPRLAHSDRQVTVFRGDEYGRLYELRAEHLLQAFPALATWLLPIGVWHPAKVLA